MHALALSAILLASEPFFPNGLTFEGFAPGRAAQIETTARWGLEAAAETPCDELAETGDGYRFMVRPWNDGPTIVRAIVRPNWELQVTVKSLGISSDESGFVLETTHQELFTGVAHEVVQGFLDGWNAQPSPYVSVEDGCEVIVERWQEGVCVQVLHPDFEFVATALMLMGVDPNQAFANGKRPRLPHEESRRELR